MFAESLLEVSPAQRLRKSWLTMSSITAQAIVVACLLMLPLVKPDHILFLKPLATPVIWSNMPLPAQAHTQPSGGTSFEDAYHVIRLPRALAFGHSHPATNDNTDTPTCVICPGLPTTNLGLFPGLPFAGVRTGLPAPPPPKLNPAQPVRISHWMEGNIISRIQPQYPIIARNARIQGQVVLQAVVSRDGAIENLKVLSGHPLLVRAAIEAVSRWRYRPYYLNGEPIEVETQITVNFLLNGGS